MIGESGTVARTMMAVLAAALGGVAGTAAVRMLALRLGIMNQPNPLVPQHTRPIAYLGGVGVALGVGSGLSIHALLGGATPGIEFVLPAVLYLVLGVFDDLRPLEPGRKFLLQALIAALAVGLGFVAPLCGVPLLDAVASWLWIVTLVNAFNLTDVCDGLLASLSAVMFGALALLDPSAAPTALVISAASLGFLVLNRPPALVFLGDAGSHLLGFMAAALTLGAAARAAAIPAMGAGVLLMAVPLFELIFLIVVRTRAGRPWWKGSSDHFSLRLQAAGLSREAVDLIACLAAAIGCSAGLALPRLPGAVAVMVAGGVVMSAFGAAAVLLRVDRTPRPGGAAVVGTSDMLSVNGANQAR